MMKNFSTYILIFFSISFFADETVIKKKLEKILPNGAEIESIIESDFPGIFKVYYGDIQPIYVSENGNYFIYGDMFKIAENEILNITDIEINIKHEVTPEQVYWKKRHAKDISRERTYKQSLGIPQNDEQPETDTNHDAATAFVAWENHITNLEKETITIAWDAHIKFLYNQNINHTNTIHITNRGEKRKFSEIC